MDLNRFQKSSNSGATTTKSDSALLSDSSRLKSSELRRAGGERPEDTPRNSTGLHATGTKVGQKSDSRLRLHSRSDRGDATLIRRRIQSWAHTGSTVLQTKGRSKLKEWGNRIQEPVPVIKHKLGRTICREQSLRSRLCLAKVTSCHPHSHRQKFLPQKVILSLLNEDSVKKELAQCFKQKASPHKLFSSRTENTSIVDDVFDVNAKAKMICGMTAETEEAAGTRSYRKILAILILIKRIPMILLFLEARICDADLPLSLGEADDAAPWKLQRTNSQTNHSHHTQKWKRKHCLEFVENQWMVLAPFFDPERDKAEEPLKLVATHILPFTSWKKGTTKGGFSKIYKVRIHSEYHAFNSNSWNWSLSPSATNLSRLSSNHLEHESHQMFIIKKLRPMRGINPMDELRVLKRFKNDKHQHLTSLLAAYVQHDTYYFIFPLAGADLLDYWEKTSPYSDSPDFSRGQKLMWLAEQCQGLAEGLACIHRHFTVSGKSLLHPDSLPLSSSSLVPTTDGMGLRKLFGRHGDIKPENILWFPSDNPSDGGVLKITDFGASEFSTKPVVKPGRRGYVHKSPSYRPPEADLNKETVSAAYDMWTLGCVYLLFMGWWVGGWPLLEEFGDRRLDTDSELFRKSGNYRSDAFFMVTQGEKPGERKAQVKPQVTDFIRELREHYNSNCFVGNFLDLVQTKMLVVISRLEDKGVYGRRSSSNVAQDLQNMRDRHHCFSRSYQAKPFGWRNCKTGFASVDEIGVNI